MDPQDQWLIELKRCIYSACLLSCQIRNFFLTTPSSHSNWSKKYKRWALEDNIPGEDLARVGIFAWNNPNIYHTQAGRGGTEPNSGINIGYFVLNQRNAPFSDSLYQLPKVRHSTRFSADLLPKSENKAKYWLWNKSRLSLQNWR